MLYKFKSKAAGDLIMLEANGRHVLQIIGKDASSAGIILLAQMPAAIAALQSAIEAEEAIIQVAKNTRSTKSDAADEAANPAASDTVLLRQRALPFVALLKTCHSAGVDIVWGV
jgi:Domain of unknown function (DUF1840)